jgi:tRNA-binding protein
MQQACRASHRLENGLGTHDFIGFDPRVSYKIRRAAMRKLKKAAAYEDFARLDIRVGKIVKVQPFPRARNPSYQIAVDVGGERLMWSSAQVTNYAPDELVGSLVVCVCNFAAKNIAGFSSELLLLGAKDSKGDVILLAPRSDVAVGAAVF